MKLVFILVCTLIFYKSLGFCQIHIVVEQECQNLYLSYDVVSEDVIASLHRPEIPFLIVGGYILLYGGPLFGKKGSGTPAW